MNTTNIPRSVIIIQETSHRVGKTDCKLQKLISLWFCGLSHLTIFDGIGLNTIHFAEKCSRFW